MSPERYVEATHAPLASRAAAVAEETEPLDAETLFRERVMLGLRVAEGVDLDAAGHALGIHGWTPARERAAAWLVGRGRVVRDGSRVRIPREAWLWTDDTAARLF